MGIKGQWGDDGKERTVVNTRTEGGGIRGAPVMANTVVGRGKVAGIGCVRGEWVCAVV